MLTCQFVAIERWWLQEISDGDVVEVLKLDTITVSCPTLYGGASKHYVSQALT